MRGADVCRVPIYYPRERLTHAARTLPLKQAVAKLQNDLPDAPCCHPERSEQRERSRRISDSFAPAKPVPVLLFVRPTPRFSHPRG